MKSDAITIWEGEKHMQFDNIIGNCRSDYVPAVFEINRHPRSWKSHRKELKNEQYNEPTNVWWCR
jgi:hypothetical protein